MTITTRVALAFAGTLLLASVLFPHVSAAWQRPPEADPEGTEYLRVNINPTPTPPMVNINPGGRVPRVNVSRMPDIRIQPTGCDSRTNCETKVEDAQRKKKAVLEKQIRIAQTRASARERKTDARRKILIGAMVLSHVDQKPESNENLLRDLDEFLERDRDRALFDLPPNVHVERDRVTDDFVIELLAEFDPAFP